MEEKIKELKEKFEGSNNYMLTLSYKDIKELFAIIEVLKEKNKLLGVISLSFKEIQDRDKKWEDKIKAKIDYLLKRYDSEEDFCSYDVLISILKSLLKKE